MAVVNEPAVPTKTGTGTARDTTPELTILRGHLNVARHNTGENVGSDHDVICVALRGPSIKTKLGHASITDWDRLRKKS